jgi:hypothetical protein
LFQGASPLCSWRIIDDTITVVVFSVADFGFWCTCFGVAFDFVCVEIAYFFACVLAFALASGAGVTDSGDIIDLAVTVVVFSIAYFGCAVGASRCVADGALFVRCTDDASGCLADALTGGAAIAQSGEIFVGLAIAVIVYAVTYFGCGGGGTVAGSPIGLDTGLRAFGA